MKHYAGDRTIDGIKVTVDGAPLDPCVNIMEFSKNGFEWSYEGPEPRQLALALLADHLGDHAAAKAAVEPFMRAIVANFGNEWEMNAFTATATRRSCVRNISAKDPGHARSTAKPAPRCPTDASFGMKYELGYDAKALWGVSAVATVPSGARTFSAGNAQFTGNLNWGYSIDSEFGLAGTLGFNAFSAYNAAGVAQSYFAFAPTLEVTAALPGGPSQLAAEYSYFSSAGPGLGGKSWFDFVYQRDFGPHVQFDVEYGFSPTFIGGQKQHYVGAGLSFMN